MKRYGLAVPIENDTIEIVLATLLDQAPYYPGPGQWIESGNSVRVGARSLDGGATWQNPVVRPVISIAPTAIGPDADLAVVRGRDLRVPFTRGADGRSVNGIRAVVSVSVMGHVLDGTDGFPRMDDVFSLPFQPVDAFDNPSGPAIQQAVVFNAGHGEVTFFPQDPVVYLVSEEAINHRLPEEKRLSLGEPIRIQGVNI